MKRITAALAPHSWTITRWPEQVFPNSTSRARWLIRVHRDELFTAGVLTRVGRDIVVLGGRYTQWLETKKTRLPDYANGVARTRSLSGASEVDVASLSPRNRPVRSKAIATRDAAPTSGVKKLCD